MIQKKSSNEHTGESGGETDKDSISPRDRTADMDTTNESSSSIEGSGVADVDAEGVSMCMLYYALLTVRQLPVYIKLIKL